MSKGEDELAFQLRHATKFAFEREYRFHPTRRWRADVAIWIGPAHMAANLPCLLVEVEGAIRGKPGRHQRIDGMERDAEKYAEAMCLGWKVLRVMPSQVKSGQALEWIERLMEDAAA